MSRSTTEPISVNGAQIGVEVRGSAEPVVLVQTALLPTRSFRCSAAGTL